MYDYIENLENLFQEEEEIIMYDVDSPDKNLDDIMVEGNLFQEKEDIDIDIVMFEENVPDKELEDIFVEDLFHEEEDSDIDIVMFEENSPDKQLD